MILWKWFLSSPTSPVRWSEVNSVLQLLEPLIVCIWSTVQIKSLLQILWEREKKGSNLIVKIKYTERIQRITITYPFGEGILLIFITICQIFKMHIYYLSNFVSRKILSCVCVCILMKKKWWVWNIRTSVRKIKRIISYVPAHITSFFRK